MHHPFLYFSVTVNRLVRNFLFSRNSSYLYSIIVNNGFSKITARSAGRIFSGKSQGGISSDDDWGKNLINDCQLQVTVTFQL